jgi:hypothetical protein
VRSEFNWLRVLKGSRRNRDDFLLGHEDEAVLRSPELSRRGDQARSRQIPVFSLRVGALVSGGRVVENLDTN